MLDSDPHLAKPGDFRTERAREINRRQFLQDVGCVVEEGHRTAMGVFGEGLEISFHE
jgi:hypothetical protein